MYFADIDSSGAILGWLRKDLHSNIPLSSIEVSEYVWKEAIEIGANFYNTDLGVFERRETRDTSEGRAEEIRAKRDKLITATSWVVDRHSQEKSLGLSTSLSDKDFKELLLYIQLLREVPQQSGFPSKIVWPPIPKVIG